MNVVYTVLLVIALIVAVLFTLLVFITGKGDAMSGGGSVRTTFKGKASFDDIISRLTLFLGIGFMALTLVLDIVAGWTERRADLARPAPNASPAAPSDAPGATGGSTGP